MIWCGSSIQRWNNLLFIFGPSGVTVYDIKDEYFPKTIEFFNLTSIFQKSIFQSSYSESRKYHRSFIIESKMENKNKVMLKFLLFGAFNEMCFNDSFYQIDVCINVDTDDKYQIDINGDNDVKDWKIPQNIGEKYNYNSKFTYLSSHWYNSRYFIIVGGYLNSKASDKIICFDHKKKKWHVGDDEEEDLPMYKMEKALLGHTSLLQQENGDLYLYVFGGCINTNYITGNTKTCIKLKLTTQMDWKIERIIWIGYMKNENRKSKNDKNSNVCHLTRLSKDVVKLVLSFLQPRFIFEWVSNW